jgi:hypothetical protein
MIVIMKNKITRLYSGQTCEILENKHQLVPLRLENSFALLSL